MKYAIRIRTGRRMLVDITDFTLIPGRITVLLGESGIGKTLIARTLFGLLPAGELDISINGQDYAGYAAGPACNEIQTRGFFVFQEPSSHLNPLMTLSEQLNEGSISDPAPGRPVLQELFPALSGTELEQLLAVYPKPYRPSGGEKQRVLIAMAFKKITLLKDPGALFVFDEPTGNLDNVYRNIFLKMLIDAHRRLPITVLLITHDYSMISEITNGYPEYSDRVDFSELRISESRQVQRPFSTAAYLDWLGTLKPAAVRSGGAGGPVLQLEQEIEVFDRKLVISKDRAGRAPAQLEIFAGDAVYLKAGSGVGKTTAAKVIMGLQRAGRFSAQIAGHLLDHTTPVMKWKKHIWAKKLSMVFQHADEALNLSGKVKDIFKGLPLPRRSDSVFIRQALAAVFEQDLPPAFLETPVAFLSGGQKQRLNLIRALILDADMLILDEPFNGLDFYTMQRILNYLQRRQRKGKSFLIISHNEEIVDRFVRPERIYYLHWERVDQSDTPRGKSAIAE